MKLSPEYQPDGQKSAVAALGKIKNAFNSGFSRFHWLHQNLRGEEIPCEISLVKLDTVDESGRELVAGFTRDLRPQLVGNDELDMVEDYFHDQISDKLLFNTLKELSDEWFFVLDIRTSIIQFFGKGCTRFGLSEGKHPFPQNILQSNCVFSEDLDAFHSLVDNIKIGSYSQSDIRLVPTDGLSIHYHRFTYRIIKNKAGIPTFAVGKALDIHEQKVLEMRSKTDLLTNCYNKITTESSIVDSLFTHKDSQHVFFIVDIDDFKSVNDNLGHHFGDIVLSEVAGNLKSIFRSHDIIGRIGGDEFIIFAHDIHDMNIIKRKAQSICTAFQNTYSGERGDYKISGSVGVARFPIDGTTYEELYKAADKALYQSKMRGKDCYTFYDKDFLAGTMKNRTILENANRMVNYFFDTEVISVTFNLLYETTEISSSINAALQYLGKRLDVDRSYIFESFDGGKTYDNTYEWCKRGIRPEIDNLQGLTYEVLSDFFRDANKDGIVYSNDLTVLKAEGAYELMADQDIKSFLHAQIREKDSVKLFLGFDDCTHPRVWSEKEVNTLTYAAKIISMFLLLNESRNLLKEGSK